MWLSHWLLNKSFVNKVCTGWSLLPRSDCSIRLKHWCSTPFPKQNDVLTLSFQRCSRSLSLSLSPYLSEGTATAVCWLTFQLLSFSSSPKTCKGVGTRVLLFLMALYFWVSDSWDWLSFWLWLLSFWSILLELTNLQGLFRMEKSALLPFWKVVGHVSVWNSASTPVAQFWSLSPKAVDTMFFHADSECHPLKFGPSIWVSLPSSVKRGQGTSLPLRWLPGQMTSYSDLTSSAFHVVSQGRWSKVRGGPARKEMNWLKNIARALPASGS